MANTPDDPAVQWSHLLGGLSTSVREIVVASLRYSANSGRPATGESVQLLVAYAEGRIDSRTYAARTLSVLGFNTVPVEHSPAERSSTRASSYATIDASFPDYSFPDYSVPATTTPHAQDPPRTSGPYERPRESAVQAYVSGRMSVDEFLRVQGDSHHE